MTDYSLSSPSALASGPLTHDPRTGLKIVPLSGYDGQAWSTWKDALLHYTGTVKVLNAKGKEDDKLLLLTDLGLFVVHTTGAQAGTQMRAIAANAITDVTTKSKADREWMVIKEKGLDLAVSPGGGLGELKEALKAVYQANSPTNSPLTISDGGAFDPKTIMKTPGPSYTPTSVPVRTKTALAAAIRRDEDHQREVAKKFEERLKTITEGLRNELEADKDKQFVQMKENLEQGQRSLETLQGELTAAELAKNDLDELLKQAKAKPPEPPPAPHCLNCSLTHSTKERQAEELERAVLSIGKELTGRERQLGLANSRAIPEHADRAMRLLRTKNATIYRENLAKRQALQKMKEVHYYESKQMESELDQTRLQLEEARLEVRKARLKNTPSEPEKSLKARLVDQEIQLNDMKLALIRTQKELNIRNARGQESADQETEILELTAALDTKERQIKETRGAMRTLVKEQLRDLEHIKEQFESYDDEILDYLNSVFNGPQAARREPQDYLGNQPLEDVFGLDPAPHLRPPASDPYPPPSHLSHSLPQNTPGYSPYLDAIGVNNGLRATSPHQPSPRALSPPHMRTQNHSPRHDYYPPGYPQQGAPNTDLPRVSSPGYPYPRPAQHPPYRGATSPSGREYWDNPHPSSPRSPRVGARSALHRPPAWQQEDDYEDELLVTPRDEWGKGRDPHPDHRQPRDWEGGSAGDRQSTGSWENPRAAAPRQEAERRIPPPRQRTGDWEPGRDVGARGGSRAGYTSPNQFARTRTRRMGDRDITHGISKMLRAY